MGPGSLGRPLSEVWGQEPENLWLFVEEVASGRDTRDVLIEHPAGRASDRAMRFSGRLVAGETSSGLALITMQEV